MHYFFPKVTKKGFYNMSIEYSQLYLNGHLYNTDTSLKRTPRGSWL